VISGRPITVAPSTSFMGDTMHLIQKSSVYPTEFVLIPLKDQGDPGPNLIFGDEKAVPVVVVQPGI
jgi:hypothetical protein